MEKKVKSGENALRESGAKIRAVLSAGVDANITIDEFAIIEEANPATERLFGYSINELIGQNVKILMPAPYQGEHDGYIQKYLRTSEKKIIDIGREVVGKHKDGTTFPMYLSVGEVLLYNNETLEIEPDSILIARDNTKLFVTDSCAPIHDRESLVTK